MGNITRVCCRAVNSPEAEEKQLPLQSQPNPAIAYSNSQGEFVDVSLVSPSKPTRAQLHLKITKSNVLPEGTTLTITTDGLANGQRKKKDGIAYFGSCLKDKGIVVNDFKIPSGNKEEDSKNRGPHFKVFVDKDAFIIQDLANGTGTYAKLENIPINIENNDLVQIGESYLLFNRIVDGDLVVKAYGPHITSFEKVFSQKLEKVSIGRLSSCDMVINDR